MYQYTWYNKRNDNSILNFNGEKPQGWIMPEDIASIMPTRWCEHCLECAVPLCYHNCENWVEREDKKCQKTFYGTRMVEFDGQLGGLFRFRKWGKMEAAINSSSVSIPVENKYERLNRYTEKIAKILSLPIKFILPTMKLCGAQHVFFERLLKNISKKESFTNFLVQYYSPCESNYSMFIEFYTPKGVFYKTSFEVKKGFHQFLFDISSLDLFSISNARVRLFPENNITEDIVLFRSDFVNLKSIKSAQDLQPAKKVKCVAWDLDNTIWNGILIEADPKKLQLKDGVLDIIKGLDNRGVIQIVNSKNDRENVIPVLKRLGIFDYFVYVFANWNAKSLNIQRAADLININVNTFALIDDSSYERGEVKESLPQVRVYPETNLSSLFTLPEFDIEVTADGQKRRLMYQTEVKRKEVQHDFNGTNVDFLKSCELKAEIQPISEERFNRSYELVQRTNQLNLSGIKYDKESFRKICFDSHSYNIVIDCHDRFGEYGQVGFIHYLIENESIVITEYAISCRVAKKWVEPAIMTYLMNKHRKNKIYFKGIDSKKNGLLINTLKEFGLKDMSQEEGNILLCIYKEKANWTEVVSVEEV